LQATKNTTRVTVTHNQNGRSVGHETAHIYEDFTVTALMQSVKSWSEQSSDIFRPTLRVKTLWRRYKKSFSKSLSPAICLPRSTTFGSHRLC